MASITGKATSKNGSLYTYEASWSVSGQNVTWDAVVIRDYQVKGTPNGVLTNPIGIEIELTIRLVVESAIFDLAGVDV